MNGLMKRFFLFICMAAALSACQKDNNWSDPTKGEDAGLFKLTDSQLASMAINLDAIPDPGTITEPYNYFSNISREEWTHLSGSEREEAIEVPQAILDQMTTLALVKTVANYPSLAEYYFAYNFPLTAMNNLIGRSALFKELTRRKNAEDILIWAFGKVAIDPSSLSLLEIQDTHCELDKLHWCSYEAFLILYATDFFNFAKSSYLDYFKAVTAHKIAAKELDLSGNTTYFFDPLLVIWDKYFGKLAPNICVASYPYEF